MVVQKIKFNLKLIAGLALSAMLASEVGFARTESKAGKKMVDAPDIEDYAEFWSNRAEMGSEEAAKAADDLRLQTIESINKLLKSKKMKNARKFELILRLGETFVERSDYMRDLETRDFEAKFTAWEKGGSKGNPPEISNKKSRNQLTRAVNEFRRIVTTFPKHHRTDAALFALGQSMMRLGNENAIMYYKQLLKRFPKSTLMPDTHLALGEFYFEKHKIPQAIDNYKEVLKHKTNRIYPYAVYKLGWSYFNASAKNSKQEKENLKKTIAAFKLVIALSDKNKGDKSSFNLKNEAIKDLVVVWADAEDVDSAWTYFKKIGHKDMFYTMLERLGSIYAEQGKTDKAITVLTRLLAEAPMRARNPFNYELLVELKELKGKTSDVVKGLKRMRSLYHGQTSWTIKNATDEQKKAEVSELVRRNVHRYGTLFHASGQKTKNKKLQEAAIEIYNLYLASFPKSEPAYEIRFYLAELLYNNKKYEEATKHYIIVSNQEVKKPKYKDDAATNAVSAMNTLVASKKYPKLPKRGQVPKAIPIPKEKLQFVATMNNYIKIFPKKKRSDELRLAAQMILFDYGHYKPALTGLRGLTKISPKSKQAKEALKVVLAYYVSKKKWLDVVKSSKEFLADKELMNKTNTKYVTDVYENALFEYALTQEKVNQYEKAAESFLTYQKEFPKSSDGDKAAYNAGINYFKIGKHEKAMASLKIVIEQYKKSKLVAKSIARVAQTYESLADFTQAADYYYKLAKDHRKNKHSAAALYNSAVFRVGLGQLTIADKTLGDFVKWYKKDALIKDAMKKQAEVAEMRNKWKQAVKLYSKIQKSKKFSKEERLNASVKMATIGVTHKVKNKRIPSLNSVFKKVLKNKKVDILTRRILAKAMFENQEKLYAKYVKMKVTDGSKVEKQVGKKNKTLQTLSTAYQNILQLGDGEYEVAALYRLGQMQENLAAVLFSAPAPRGSNQAQIDAYKSSLEKVAFPLKEEAYKFFDAAFKRSGEVSTFTEWTKRAYDKMVELEPTKFKEIKYESVSPTYVSHELYGTKQISALTEK